MLSGWLKGTVLAGTALFLAGCVSDRDIYEEAPAPGPDIARQMPASPEIVAPNSKLECVPFAREHSEVKIFGDAWTWWDKAEGRFARQFTPESGSVMVLAGYAGPKRGHVAVVRSLISSREIRVDHANWLGDGAIYLDDPVADVSPGNDWSEIRVWNIRAGAWGARIYPVQGFIGPGTPDQSPQNDDGDAARIARAELGIIQ